MGKFWEDYRGGVGKSGVQPHKSEPLHNNTKRTKFHQKRFSLLVHSFQFSSTMLKVVKVDIKVTTSASLTLNQCLQSVTYAAHYCVLRYCDPMTPLNWSMTA